jgi:hypothetical protein
MLAEQPAQNVLAARFLRPSHAHHAKQILAAAPIFVR